MQASSTITATLSSSSGTATIQQEFGRGFLVEVGYLGSKGQHLIDGESNMTFNQLPASYFALGNQLLGTNQVPNPFFGVITNPNSTLSRPTIPYNQLLRPYPAVHLRKCVPQAAGELALSLLHIAR